MLKPPLTLRVGFAGHRDSQPKGDPPRTGDVDLLTHNLDAVFTLIRDCVQALESLPIPRSDETVGDAFAGRRLQLVTGVAPGADRRAIERWRTADMGPVHALTPFLDPATGEALTDDPREASPWDQVTDLATFETFTCLDPAAHGRHGHAELSRWIVRHSEVLVVVWDGAPPGGPGGTADAVRLGLAKGLPVIWIAPNSGEVLLLDPFEVWTDDGALERASNPMQIAKPATVASLVGTLDLRFRPPTSRASSESGDDHGGRDKEKMSRDDFERNEPRHREWMDRLLQGNLWQTYAWFKKTLGGTYVGGAAMEPATSPEAEAGPGFQTLRRHFEFADQRANVLSAAHRSEQLLLLAIAFAAVAAGALPAPLDRPLLHIVLLLVELSLGALGWWVWFLGHSQYRHRRWSDDRRLSERLRAGMVTFPLGFDIADQRPGAPQTWTEWRARAVLREAGVTSGVLTKPVLESRLRWASAELIDSQARYHKKEAVVVERLTHKLHQVETGTFIVLVLALICALLAACLATQIKVYPVTPPTPLQEFLERVIKGVTFLSAVLPALGAAIFAIEATNGFSEIAERSAQIAPSFEELGRRMRTDGFHSGAQGQEIIREAAVLMVADANSWRDQLVRRRLTRG